MPGPYPLAWLKREIFSGSLLVHCRGRQIPARIHGSAADSDFVMQVRRGDAPRAPGGAEQVAPPHFLSGMHVDAREVRVVSLDAAAVVHYDQPAVTRSEERRVGK